MRDETIEGLPHFIFMQNLFKDSLNQLLEPMSQLFGIKYLEMGVWKSHQDTNRRISIYRAWAKSFIHERMEITKKEIS